MKIRLQIDNWQWFRTISAEQVAEVEPLLKDLIHKLSMTPIPPEILNQLFDFKLPSPRTGPLEDGAREATSL